MPTIERLHELLAVSSSCDSGQTEVLVTKAHQLANRVPSVEAEMTNEEVREILGKAQEADSLAVIDDTGAPIGLINRNIFLEAYSKPYAREIYGRRSCIAWMDKEALIVDWGTPIEELVKLSVAKGAKVLKDGFVITQHGTYAGLGTGFSLMQAMEGIEREKSRQILQSIDYASTIQRSHLSTSQAALGLHLPDPCLIWQPRDVVGGDCFFFRKVQGGVFGALVDCTGHGVPGAFMTLIALSFLEQRIAEDKSSDPGEVLTDLNRYIKQVLSQRSEEKGDGKARSDDGMDALAFVLPEDGRSLTWASARLALVLRQEASGDIQILEGERQGVGYVDTADDAVWTSQQLALDTPTRVLIFTDGVTDQIGGPKSIALGKKRVCQWFSQEAGAGASAIDLNFRHYFEAWQGDQTRRDDLTLLTFSAGRRPS